MSTSFHLCREEDLDTLLALVQRRLEEAGTPADPDHLRAGLSPLTEEGPAGAAWLFGPRKAPVGYLTLTFNWSVTRAAQEAQICDVFIRPSVRRRGLATEALIGVGNALRGSGVSALRMDLTPEASDLLRLAKKAGFSPVPGMTNTVRVL